MDPFDDLILFDTDEDMTTDLEEETLYDEMLEENEGSEY